jgi:ABC-type polysaccharide/polyol phosphate transport system ATPase subunit
MNTLGSPLRESDAALGQLEADSVLNDPAPLLGSVSANAVAEDIVVEVRNVSYWRGAASYLRKQRQSEATNQLLEFGRSRNDVLDHLLEFGSMFLNVRSLARGEISGCQLERTLNEVSVRIPRGSVVCVADIGCLSRMALMRIIAKVIPPKSGEVILRGKVVSLEQVEAIPMPYRTIRHNLLSLGRLLGLQREEVLAAFPSMEAFTGRPELFDLPVRRVPKAKKFDIALSLVCSGAFDVVVAQEIRKSAGEAWLRFLNEAPRRGKTLIISSSKLDDALEQSTHALLLNEGRLLDFGTTAAMKERHADFIEAACRASTLAPEDDELLDDDGDDE